MRGHLYDSAWYSGYSVAYWKLDLAKGDRVKIVTDASGTDSPPCQMLYLPDTGEPDATTPLLNPTTSSRNDHARRPALRTGRAARHLHARDGQRGHLLSRRRSSA